MTAILKVNSRDLTGPSGKKLRCSGIVPAVFYGRGIENNHFTIATKDIDSLLKTEEHVVQLIVDGKGKELALIQEIQKEPLSGKVLHVSFLKVKKGETTRVTIPIHLEGKPIGVKNGGDLNQALREIEVECAPENVPDSIHVDIKDLDIDQVLHLSDALLPKGVKFLESDLESNLEIASIRHHKVEDPTEEEGKEESAASEGDKPEETKAKEEKK